MRLPLAKWLKRIKWWFRRKGRGKTGVARRNVRQFPAKPTPWAD